MITYDQLRGLGIGDELLDDGRRAWVIRTVTDDGRWPRRRCVLLYHGGDDRVLRLHEGKTSPKWHLPGVAAAGPTAASQHQGAPERGGHLTPQPGLCACNSFQLTWYGHDAGCPEKRR